MCGVIRRTTTPQPPPMSMVSQFASSPPTPGPRHRHLLLLRVRASLAAPIQARLVTPSWVLTISHALTYVRARRGAPSTRSCFRIFVSPCLRTDLGERRRWRRRMNRDATLGDRFSIELAIMRDYFREEGGVDQFLVSYCI